MAIGAITSVDAVGFVPKAPVFVDRISFAGDGTYPAGGTPGFKALLQAITKDQRQPVMVVAQDCGGYSVTYDEAGDKLKVWQNGAINGPAVENTTANLSGITFNVVVISK